MKSETKKFLIACANFWGNHKGELKDYKLYFMQQQKQLCLLFTISFLICSIVHAQSKIVGIQAKLFYNEDRKDSESKKVSGTFSENIIDNNEFTLWNTIIGEGSAEGYSRQTIVIVEIKSNDRPNKEQTLKFTATANKKVLFQQLQTFSCLNNNTTYRLLFLLNDTGCDEVSIRADLIQNQRAISTLTKHLNFKCGE